MKNLNHQNQKTPKVSTIIAKNVFSVLDQANVTQFNTNTIAYKLSSEEMRAFMDYVPTSEEFAQFRLIGLQLEVKEKNLETNEWEYLDYLRFSQVYFNDSPEDGITYFLRCPIPLDNLLTVDKTHFILANENMVTGLNWHTIEEDPWSLPTSEESYAMLDFYVPKIAFVYFSIGQLTYLTTFFETLIISGYQFNMGKKLQHLPTDGAKRFNYRDDYFSLKIEGVDLVSNAEIVTKVASDPSETIEMEDTEGASVVLGHPCPPKWESFMAIIESEISNNSDLVSRLPQIWGNWASQVYYLSGGEDLAVQNDQF